MKWNKPKVTNHKRKVDDNLREELKNNLKTEIPQLTKQKRYAKLLERIPNLSVSVHTI